MEKPTTRTQATEMYVPNDLVFETHVLRVDEVIEVGSRWITVMARRITKAGLPDKRDSRPRQRSFWHEAIIEIR
jgi:hypothetical protein